LVIAVALLGPRWLRAITTLACPAPFRRDAGGFLSAASVHARSRRLSLAATPLIIAVALSAVQLFTTTTTMIAAARQQASSGLTADYVLTGTGSGLAPGIARMSRHALRRGAGYRSARTRRGSPPRRCRRR
jgi:putative ABC transport system permease protein